MCLSKAGQPDYKLADQFLTGGPFINQSGLQLVHNMYIDILIIILQFRLSILSVITDCHRISKKQDLYTELADIGNWEALCTHLEVPEGKIDELVHGNLENIAKKERCLAAYVDQGNACWEKVIEVVRGYPFYKNSLATQIAEKYGVGG